MEDNFWEELSDEAFFEMFDLWKCPECGEMNFAHPHDKMGLCEFCETEVYFLD